MTHQPPTTDDKGFASLRALLSLPPPQTDLKSLARDLYGWPAAAHHAIWADALTKLQRGEIPNDRLLIIAPPGHAKTNWCGIAFPTWYLGHNPYSHVLSFSATSTLSTKASLTIRDTIQSQSLFKEMFPAVTPNMRRGWTSQSWYLERPNAPGDKDPSYFATSVDSDAVLGGRGDLLGFDDISTQSNTATRYRREKVKDRVEQTAMSRATPSAKMFCAMTRWHTDDMAGYFEREHGFHVIVMPANGYWEHPQDYRLARMDEAPLWPEHVPEVELVKSKRSLGPFKYTAMFQGNPTAVEGAIYKEEHFGPFYIPFETPAAVEELSRHKRATTPPYNAVVNHEGQSEPIVKTVQLWDTALVEKDSADYTVCATWAVTVARKAYLLNVWRRQIDAVELFEAFIREYRLMQPDRVAIENKASGIQLIQDIQRKTAIPVDVINPTSSKEERARSQSHVIKGAFRVPDPELAAFPSEWFPGREPDWVALFLAEHVEFPRGSYADQVDTTSMAGEALRWDVDFFLTDDADIVAEFPEQVRKEGDRFHVMPTLGGQYADVPQANGEIEEDSGFGVRYASTRGFPR